MEIMLSDRQESILEIVINEYVQSAQPIGSFTVSKRRFLKLSPATIRNEMNELEETDFLYQPYTSAGRIPTVKGWRYFIENLMEERKLDEEEKKLLSGAFDFIGEEKKFLNELTKRVAKISRDFSAFFVKDLNEFIYSGMEELFNHPELNDDRQMLKAAQILDQFKNFLEDISISETKILIGKENIFDETGNFSLMLEPFGFEEKNGILALFGPSRMDYGRNKALFNFIKEQFENFQ